MYKSINHLVVADGQVRHFAPAYMHYIKAAVRLPAKHSKCVLRAAVQTATIRIKQYTPAKREKCREFS